MRKRLTGPFAYALLGGLITGLLLLAFQIVRPTEETTLIRQSPLVGAPTLTDEQGREAPTLREIYRKVSPGVVFVRTHAVASARSPFDPTPQSDISTASGLVLDKKGYILTNSHVIEHATDVRVTVSNSNVLPAKVIGKDLNSDIALLKIDPKKARLLPVQLGDSSTLSVSDPVITISNPFGRERTLLTGVVAALKSRITSFSGFTIDDVIQTDTIVGQGTSGSALLDAGGQVIGFNTQLAATKSGSYVPFAVPVDTVGAIISELKDRGRVRRSYLGLDGVGITEALKSLDLPVSKGVLVQRVRHGSPAQKGGIRGGDTDVTINGERVVLGGDIVERIDQRQIRSMEDISAFLNGSKPNDVIRVQVLRKGVRRNVSVRLGDRPAQQGQQ